MSSKPEDLPPEVENQHHTYITNQIPWYVHLIWVTYWIMAITYIIYYQFPVISSEFLNPP